MTAMPKLGPVVAIDGPAGTGKSSATRRLAESLGFIHIDTGALYRSIAVLLIEKGLLPEMNMPAKFREEAIQLARSSHLEFKRVNGKNPSNRIYVNARDLTDFIRTPQVSLISSQVSAIPEVRSALLGLQRRMGCVGKSILEGRDIGTVIFPDAEVKFFLTASVNERAKRRLAELEATGVDTPSFEEVKSQIISRDAGDSNRSVAPLRKASDAIELDTSEMTLDEVVRTMEAKVRQILSL